MTPKHRTNLILLILFTIGGTVIIVQQLRGGVDRWASSPLNVLQGSTCQLPCWYGLTPGTETTPNQVSSALSGVSFISSAAPRLLSPQEGSTHLTYGCSNPLRPDCVQVFIQDGLLLWITFPFQPAQPLANLIEILGSPDYYSVPVLYRTEIAPVYQFFWVEESVLARGADSQGDVAEILNREGAAFPGNYLVSDLLLWREGAELSEESLIALDALPWPGLIEE